MDVGIAQIISGRQSSLHILRYKFRLYYNLVKPGIVYSNVLTAVAGYIFASRWQINWHTLLTLTGGTASIIAAACALNNYTDRTIDAAMTRTKKRAMVTGEISTFGCGIVVLAMVVAGFLLLSQVNVVTLGIGFVSLVWYVGIYGHFKRVSVHGTLVGTVPGAASLIAGCTAWAPRFTPVLLLLFCLMAAWQMAHFYSIALYRKSEYASAGLPVRSVSKGAANTKRHIIGYIGAFFVLTVLVTALGYDGYFYLIILGSASTWWLVTALMSYKSMASRPWGRRLFFQSLVVLLAMIMALPVGRVLP